jgi:hypothetical protein
VLIIPQGLLNLAADKSTPVFEEQKAYEFFLADVSPIKLPSGLKLKLTWRSVDSGYDIVEYSLIDEAGIPGPRLLELLQRLKLLPESLATPVNAQSLLRRNTKLYAEVQRHYPSSKSEQAEWEFRYSSIAPELHTTTQVSERDTTRVKFLARQSKTLKELRLKLKSTEPHLLPAFEQLVQSGELGLS